MAWGSKKSMNCSRALQSKADFHVFRKTIFGFRDPGFEGSVFKTENFRYQCMAHEIFFFAPLKMAVRNKRSSAVVV